MLCIRSFAAVTLLAASSQAQFAELDLATGLAFGSPGSIHCGDMDGDGDMDPVVAAANSSAVYWYESIPGAGPSVQHLVTSSVNVVTFVRTEDIDGDGHVDVLVGGFDYVGWFENDGSGGFAIEHVISSQNGSGFYGAFADLDSDGDPDLVLTTKPNLGGTDGAVVVYRNEAGALLSTQSLGSVPAVGRPVLVDLDGDGDLDIITADVGGPSGRFYRNDSVPGGPINLTLAGTIESSDWTCPTDFDGDGDLDLLLVYKSSAGWIENLGAGSFGPYTYLVGPHPPPSGNMFIYQGECADIDGDGDDDLILSIRPTNTTSAGTKNRIAWFENMGNQVLGPIQNLVPSPWTYTAFIGFDHVDFDGDGDVDVIGTQRINSATATLKFHRNDHFLGTNFCDGVPNSSGSQGNLRVSGSRVVELNQMRLTADSLPPNRFGFFIVAASSQPPVTPMGSQGTLCLSGPIGRFAGPGQIMNSGPDGTFFLDVDLTAVPTPMGPSALMPGDTRYFQCWHRDLVGSSNLTNATQVDFL